MINILDQVISKEATFKEFPVWQGALISLVAIIMVFLILVVIIGITTLVFKMNGLFDMKKELDAAKNKSNASSNVSSKASTTQQTVNITDDDMMAAVLVATIDYRNEIKKDVRVVSIKEVK